MNNSNNKSVYVIRNILTNDIMYVGKTTNFYKRSAYHRSVAKHGYGVSAICKGITAVGVENVEITELCNVDAEMAGYLERQLVMIMEPEFNVNFNKARKCNAQSGDRRKPLTERITRRTVQVIKHSKLKQRELVEKYGISQHSVSRIKNGYNPFATAA